MFQAPADEDRCVCYIRRTNGVGDSVRTLRLVGLVEGPFRRQVAIELTVLVGKRPMGSVSQPGTDLGEKVLKVKAITYTYPVRVGEYAPAEFFKKFVCILCTVKSNPRVYKSSPPPPPNHTHSHTILILGKVKMAHKTPRCL
jgi:hypothetical protein